MLLDIAVFVSDGNLFSTRLQLFIKITVVGFDSGKTQIEAIKAGTQAGAVTQSPVKIGYETVKAAILAVNGKDLPKTIDSGFA